MIKKRFFSENNLKLALTYHNIGVLYLKLNKYTDSESHLLKSWQIKGKGVKLDNLSLLSTASVLCEVYKKANKSEERMKWLEEKS